MNAISLDRKALRRMPLPEPAGDGDKETRGAVLVVGGAPVMPGAVLLASVAALRVGAGKLQIATARSVAPSLAVEVPEAYVLSLPETASGAVGVTAAEALAEHANEVDSVVIGPGMVEPEAIGRLLERLLPTLTKPAVVLDALALVALADRHDLLRETRVPLVLTPHAGEMAQLMGLEREAVEADPQAAALEAARRTGAVVALKGAHTFIATPDGQLFVNRSGSIGLATSGSGDTLAGLVGGLLARGADPVTAACWGVQLHARAGRKLARRMGPLGFLARELLAEIPPIMASLRR